MNVVLAILTGVVIAAVSSWITVNLSLRRYHSERWWDRKVEAYTAVLEALHNSKAFSDRHLAALENGSELPKDKEEELLARARAANDQIIRAMDLGSFLLSSEALERLKQFRKDEGKATDTTSWLEHLEIGWKASDSCLKDMIVIAKKDLKPNPNILWRVRK